eukprot:m51a1_g5623 hypothetical protein (145) ;mRNA; f:778854-779387
MVVVASKARTSGGVYAETYGFASWVTTYVVFVLYLVWAFVPRTAFQAAGLEVVYDELPSRYWALAVPAYVVVLAVFVLAVYQGILLRNIEPLDSPRVLFDKYGSAPPALPGCTTSPSSAVQCDADIAAISRSLYSSARCPWTAE